MGREDRSEALDEPMINFEQIIAEAKLIVSRADELVRETKRHAERAVIFQTNAKRHLSNVRALEDQQQKAGLGT